MFEVITEVTSLSVVVPSDVDDVVVGEVFVWGSIVPIVLYMVDDDNERVDDEWDDWVWDESSVTDCCVVSLTIFVVKVVISGSNEEEISFRRQKWIY